MTQVKSVYLCLVCLLFGYCFVGVVQLSAELLRNKDDFLNIVVYSCLLFAHYNDKKNGLVRYGCSFTVLFCPLLNVLN